MADRSTRQSKQAYRFVAVRQDVVAIWRAWEVVPLMAKTVRKLLALADALVSGDQQLVQQLLSRNDVDSIRNCPGLVELGPKQQRGGAPRAFLFRRNEAAFFVASGVEKGSRGVGEIGLARTRADGLRGITYLGTTVEETRTKLGADWSVLGREELPSMWWGRGGT